MTVADYNRCVDINANAVYRFILKNLRDADRAQDVVQEVFAKMWEKRDDINSEKSKSYLFTAAYHTMIDTIRRDKRTTLIDNYSNHGSYDQKQYTGAKKVIEEALQRLPEIQRIVVMLRDYEGYSYQEIGEITNLNESQVKVYIYRARLALKNYLVSIDNLI
ncbi:MAG: RNA polymerase sigma factor [Bacteroidales bacterium]|jgi:RNA polymerase sigma-70 factor (ECF subfamily)|nr:RNA polymerase sigma factor [Bacteroidales bacterium]